VCAQARFAHEECVRPCPTCAASQCRAGLLGAVKLHEGGGAGHRVVSCSVTLLCRGTERRHDRPPPGLTGRRRCAVSTTDTPCGMRGVAGSYPARADPRLVLAGDRIAARTRRQAGARGEACRAE